MSVSRKKVGFDGILPAVFFIVVLSYFLYHAISGERGILAYQKLTKQINEVRAELDVVHAARLKYERNVQLMRDESLDLDLLDEQARRLLGYAHPDERVYYLKN